MRSHRLSLVKSHRKSLGMSLVCLSAALVACSSESQDPAPQEPGHIGGFSTPESVLHDEERDVYLVANINGSPGDKDDNGFISRVSPDGEILELAWIDGAAEDVALSAPKGMAIAGGTLYVADIDAVRVFDATDGAPIRSIDVPGASFLNDVAAMPDGSVVVSDTGIAFVDGSITPTGSDALVVIDPGRFLVSSWEASAVFEVDLSDAASPSVSPIADELPGPADIDWDSGRNRLLVPLFMDNELALIDRK